MAGKIFYREREKVTEGKKQPRYRLVAVADVNLKVYGKHLRRSELEQIASAVGAELILLSHGDKKYKDDADDTVEVND
jgi:exopolysaccharide biosynthesis protein